MTAPTQTGLQDLEREYPEWKPWLAVVGEALREAADPKWEALVPPRAEPQQSRVPLLSGATLTLETGAIRLWVERLMRTASRSGAPKMSTFGRARHARLNPVALFAAALRQDGERLRETAAELEVDAEALQSISLLIPVPLLQACNRSWGLSKSEGWTEGYCLVCGAWPVFAEVRGIERSRYFRCGRCGGEWQAHCLSCPYCATTDHEQLASLVPEKGTARVVDACKRCLGYVKTFTTLQGSPPAKVILDDLASVDLDVAALEQGYKRPEGTGYSLDVTVIDKPGSSGKIFSWR
jgi:FdhE protein